MEKKLIIDKIKILALENGGKPPGKSFFTKQTGIRFADWYPKLWLRWGDALVEAGFQPNQLATRTSDEELFDRYAEFVRELGHIPLEGELRLRKKSDPTFPTHTSFRRNGAKKEFIKAFLAYCADRPELADVASICEPYLLVNHPAASKRTTETRFTTGFVYLMKSGNFYKIGHTVSVERRERDIGLIIPNLPKTIHWIETDDPRGIESYWHRRFAEKRTRGEWFNLSREDVEAFKRWKKLV